MVTSEAPNRRRRIALGCGLLIVLLVAGLWIMARSLAHELPEGSAGAEADALAHEMMQAVDVDAWHATGAVAWDFGGRQQHLWDRERQLARVRWAENEVLLDLDTRSGRAWTGGAEVTAEADRDPLLEAAWAHWCNDSFWLNPVAKLFDEGVERRLVDVDGGRGLLVTYTSGGVTPGDAYLWLVGDDGVPTAWRMWTQILPVQGLEASWEDWTRLDTGAMIAGRHRIAVIDLELTDLRAAETLDALGEGDAFAPIRP
ncbi:MAG: hypothetical protein AAGE94_01050 [Acidobacteriota bacterium]